jgi:hypothetical protein
VLHTRQHLASQVLLLLLLLGTLPRLLLLRALPLRLLLLRLLG